MEKRKNWQRSLRSNNCKVEGKLGEYGTVTVSETYIRRQEEQRCRPEYEL